MLCLPNLVGCPFVLDFIEVEQNVAPQITQSSPGLDQPLEFSTEQYTAFVVVRDPDDTDLQFVWSIEPSKGVQSDAVPIRSGDLLGSQLTIIRDVELDEQRLVVTVYDPAGATDRREWDIVVPEAP